MENVKEREDQENVTAIQTPGALIMKRFLKNKLAVVGLAIIGFILTFCLIGPFFHTIWRI